MLLTLLNNYEEAAAIVLFGIGFTMLLLHRNLIKKLIGMNIMDTGIFLFLASMGYRQKSAHHHGWGDRCECLHKSCPCRTRADGHCRLGLGHCGHALAGYKAVSKIPHA